MLVGLGNPGRRYQYTRHNVGFAVLDQLAARERVRFRRSWRVPAQTGKLSTLGQELLLVKPQTFMNRSGHAVELLMRQKGLVLSDLTVILDDADLECGRIRIRKKGGAGGHQGLKSVVQALDSEEFARVRMGVGPRPPGDELMDYVLSNFSEAEKATMDMAVKKAVDVVLCIMNEGLEQAMNRFN